MNSRLATVVLCGVHSGTMSQKIMKTARHCGGILLIPARTRQGQEDCYEASLVYTAKTPLHFIYFFFKEGNDTTTQPSVSNFCYLWCKYHLLQSSHSRSVLLGWRDNLVVRSVHCSSRVPGFDSQHPCENAHGTEYQTKQSCWLQRLPFSSKML